MPSRAGAPRTTMTDDVRLNTLVPEAGTVKQQMSALKKNEAALVDAIKECLGNLGISEYAAGGFTAKTATIDNDSLDEAAAMQLLKEELAGDPELLQIIIRTREYIDHDSLERAVYSRKVPEGLLATCIVHKEPTVRLTVSADKKKKF